MKDFSETLYMTRENENEPDNEFLNSHDTLDECAELGVEKRVGVYTLKETVTLRTKVEASAE